MLLTKHSTVSIHISLSGRYILVHELQTLVAEDTFEEGRYNPA